MQRTTDYSSSAQCQYKSADTATCPHQIFVAEIAEAQHRGLLLGLTVPVMAVGVLAVYGLGGWEVETPL